MGADYDMLGQLGVVIPDTKVAAPLPPAGSRHSGHKILRPTERAPRPARAASMPSPMQRTLAPREASISPTRVRDVPRSPGCSVYSERGPPERTVLKLPKGRGAYYEEFEVYDSEVPSNMAYNAQLLKAREAEGRYRREMDERMMQAAVQRDAEKEAEARRELRMKKERQQRELVAGNEERRRAESQHASRQAAEDRRLRERMAETYDQHVADAIGKEQQKRANQERFRQELDRLVQQRADKAAGESQYRMRPDIDGFQIGDGVDRVDRAAQAKMMRRAWVEQLDMKEEMQRVDRERDRRLYDQSVNDSKAHNRMVKEETQQRRAKNAHFMGLQKEMLSQKQSREDMERQRELMNDRHRADRDREDHVRKTHEDKTRAKSYKEAWRANLQKQMVEHAAADARRMVDEGKPHMAHNGLGMTQPRKILLRCPITNQLLPPSAFNLHAKPAKRIYVP